MILDRYVVLDDRFNVLQFLDHSGISGLIVMMPRRRQRFPVIVDQPFHCLGFGPLVACAPTFFVDLSPQWVFFTAIFGLLRCVIIFFMCLSLCAGGHH